MDFIVADHVSLVFTFDLMGDDQAGAGRGWGLENELVVGLSLYFCLEHLHFSLPLAPLTNVFGYS